MRGGALAVHKGHRDAQCAHGGAHSVERRLVRLDFSSSVNPLGPPRAAVEAIRKSALKLAPEYPDPECKELRASLCEYLGDVSKEQLCIGNGALEIIHWFAHAFARRKVVIPSPTFCEYELASSRAGAEVISVPFERTGNGTFVLDSDKVLEASKGASALYLCNPNNPTGQTIAKTEIERILSGLADSTMVLLDECFIELSDRAGDSFSGRTGEFENLVVLRSLTKSFALAGLRLGYSISNAKTAETLAANRIYWNVNGLAQAAGTAALGSAERYLAKARSLIAKERGYMKRTLDSGDAPNQYQHEPSESNFFLIRLPKGFSPAAEFRDRLLRKTGVLVRDCSTFAGMDDSHIRVAVKTRHQNVELLGSLQEMKVHG